jgi:hypothetical protein
MRLKQFCGFPINSIVQIPWNAEEYYREHIKLGRDPKRKRFPNPNFGSFSEPLTVVDSEGHIVLWYLPGLLSEIQQVIGLCEVQPESSDPFHLVRCF